MTTTPYRTILGPNQPTYQQLQLALGLNLRRQIFVAVCDDLILRDRLAAQLQYEINESGNESGDKSGDKSGSTDITTAASNPDDYSNPDEPSTPATHNYPRLVSLQLRLDEPNPLIQIAQWLTEFPPPIVNGQRLPMPAFQILGIEHLTRQAPAVQRLFFTHLQSIERNLPLLDFSLLIWTTQPWYYAIPQSAPEFWRCRTGIFEFVGDPTPLSITAPEQFSAQSSQQLLPRPVTPLPQQSPVDSEEASIEPALPELDLPDVLLEEPAVEDTIASTVEELLAIAPIASPPTASSENPWLTLAQELVQLYEPELPEAQTSEAQISEQKISEQKIQKISEQKILEEPSSAESPADQQISEAQDWIEVDPIELEALALQSIEPVDLEPPVDLHLDNLELEHPVSSELTLDDLNLDNLDLDALELDVGDLAPLDLGEIHLENLESPALESPALESPPSQLTQLEPTEPELTEPEPDPVAVPPIDEVAVDPVVDAIEPKQAVPVDAQQQVEPQEVEPQDLEPQDLEPQAPEPQEVEPQALESRVTESRVTESRVTESRVTPQRQAIPPAVSTHQAITTTSPIQVPAEVLIKYQQSMPLVQHIEQLHQQQATPAVLAEAYRGLGNFYRDRVEQGDVTSQNLEIAIQAYEQTLLWLPESSSLWVDVLNDMGNLYWMLSRTLPNPTEALSYLQQGVRAYQLALTKLNPKNQAYTYPMVQNNLGAAYADLARHHEPVANLELSIQSYRQALRYRTPETDPLRYASTQNNLGTTYWNLAQYKEPVTNLKYAIEAYSHALHYYNPLQEPLNYAMIQNNLGTAYWNLAQHERAQDWLILAVSSYRMALQYRTLESAPAAYAATQNNLGTAYWHLANTINKLQERFDYLQQAITAYETALYAIKYLQQHQPQAAPLLNFDLFATHNNLGLAHYQTATDHGETLDITALSSHFKAALDHHVRALQGWENKPNLRQTALNCILQTTRAAYSQLGLPGQSLALSRIPGQILPEILPRL